MVKIRDIQYWEKGDRYYVKLTDGRELPIRRVTFQAMKLEIGQEITFEELKEFECFVYKKLYGPHSWENEKIRISKVKNLILQINPRLKIETVGFGANTNQTLLFHPSESGSPDLRIKNDSDNIVAFIEVSGTERMREGEGYWVRKDKLEYAQKYPNKNIWIILHYQEPDEKFIFIKTEPNKSYRTTTKTIRGVDEPNYVVFNDGDPELRTFDAFRADVINW